MEFFAQKGSGTAQGLEPEVYVYQTFDLWKKGKIYQVCPKHKILY